MRSIWDLYMYKNVAVYINFKQKVIFKKANTWKCPNYKNEVVLHTPGLVGTKSHLFGEPVNADCHLVMTEVQI